MTAPRDDPHSLILKGLLVVMVAMLGAAAMIVLFGLGAPAGPAPNNLLVVTSAFLVATLSVTVVMYILQWNYFDRKSPGDKAVAVRRTLLVFWAELLYVVIAFSAVLLNSFAAIGFVPWAYSAGFGWFAAGLFLVLVLLEMHSSIRNVKKFRQPADP